MLVATAIAVVAALAAACCFALGSLVQQGVARQTGERILHYRLLLSLLRQPRWVGGISLALGSFVIQAIALAYGPLTLVQPLAATDVLFALPFIARRNRRGLTRRDAAGALLVTTGIVVFLALSPPAGGTSTPGLAAWTPAILVIGALVSGSAVAALRVRGRPRVIWLAAAAACCYGLLDALTKSTVGITAARGAGVLAAWEPYALVTVGIIGALFGQSAFGSGALSLSLPVIDTLEPVSAVIIGATVFGERLASSPAHLAIQLLGGGAAVAGIAVLSSSSIVRTETQLTPGAAGAGERTEREETARGHGRDRT
jgi:drug/metabolite transporter (DMT)-like permease